MESAITGALPAFTLTTVFHAIDRSINSPVLITDRLRSHLQYICMFVHEANMDALTTVLEQLGFTGQKSTVSSGGSERWLTFRGCQGYAIDVSAIEKLRLQPSELSWLLRDVTVPDSFHNVAQLGAHHTLLLTARQLADQDAYFSHDLRARLNAEVLREPGMWEIAKEQANEWGLGAALLMLRRTCGWDGPESPQGKGRFLAMRGALGSGQRLRGLARRRGSGRHRATRIITFSGLDGSGKSSQVRALQSTLHAFGFESVVEWVPLGLNPSVRVLRRYAKGAMWAFAKAAGRRSPAALASGGSLIAGPNPLLLRRQNGLITQVWSTFVGVASASRYRWTATKKLGTVDVIIYDRYALDSIAQLRYFYGSTRQFRLQRWLIRTIAPTPAGAYLLDVRPETALQRKPEQYNLEQLRLQSNLLREEARLLRVRQLDGERNLHQLCKDIAADVLGVS